MTRSFVDFLDKEQLHLVMGLDTPFKIQAFLDSIPYSAEDTNRSPVSVLRDRQAHCLDGALFAAAALRRLGYPPLVLDMFPEPGSDDDHVLAVYHRNGRFGALAKSNYTGLRFREPVYASLRELVMTYFDVFYNVNGQKTLRSYTPTLNLASLDHLEWEWSDAKLVVIEYSLASLRRYPLLTPEMIEILSPMDERSFDAGMLGVNTAGLYRPRG